MVVTGDPSQSDLLPGQSGLVDIAAKFEVVSNIAVVRLADVDIVRHPLVAEILGVLGNDNHGEKPLRPETMNGSVVGINGASHVVKVDRATFQ